MDKQSYLTQLRADFVHHGESYLAAVKEGRPYEELRRISRLIRSIVAEIKALEYDMQLMGFGRQATFQQSKDAA